MQYKIFEGNMNRLEKKLQRISNKCMKYGNDFTYEKIGEEVRSLADEVPFDIPDSVRSGHYGHLCRHF